MKTYLYREGNGNDGNFPRFLLELDDEQDPYAALAAICVASFRLAIRPYIIDNLMIDGEAEFGIDAMVCEGPDGETDFGAAWFTAELQPAGVGEDLDDISRRYATHTLAEYLDGDTDAMAYYEKESSK